MKYRSRTEIAARILVAANVGIPKTKLMYTTFLSYNQLKEYVAFLKEKGLLTHDEMSMTFRTTPKGREYIDMFYKLNEISGFALADSIRSDARERKLPAFQKYL
jgi:predicted transcriptional regulator